MSTHSCYGIHIGNSIATLVEVSLDGSSRNRFRLFDWKIIDQDSSVFLLDDDQDLDLGGDDSINHLMNGKFGREIETINNNDDYQNPHHLICNVVHLLTGKDDVVDNTLTCYSNLHLVQKEQELSLQIGNHWSVSPMEIYLVMVRKLLERNKSSIDKKKRMVIAFPNQFSNREQQKYVREQVREWGYNVMHGCSESSLALYAYNLVRPLEMNSNILYLDLGNSLHVEWYEIDDMMLHRKYKLTSHRLFGEEMTQIMVEYCANIFKNQHFHSIFENPQSVVKLRKACEEAKIKLARNDSCSIHISNLFNNIDFDLILTRNVFEELMKGVFEQIIAVIAGFIPLHDGETIDKIVLCGSSTKIPKLERMIRNLIGTKAPSLSDDKWYNYLEHPSAIGAAIYAFIMNNPNCLMNDLTCSNMGISNQNGECIVIVPRGSVVPCLKKRIISLNTIINVEESSATSVSIDVFHGNRPMVKDCEKIGQLNLPIIDSCSSDSRQTMQIEIIFELFFSSNLQMIVSARWWHDDQQQNDGMPSVSEEDSFIISSCSVTTKDEIEELIRMVASAQQQLETSPSLSADHHGSHTTTTDNFLLDEID